MHNRDRASARADEAGTRGVPESGAVILAAGAGRRMGGVPKSLLRRDGEPLLLRQARLAAAAGIDVIVVVLGHHAERLTAALEQARDVSAPGAERLRWTTNPTPDVGTGSSLRCGLAALPASLAIWLVMLGDQPLLEAGDVRAVLDAWNARSGGIELVVPQHSGQPGHPIAFGKSVRNAVLQMQGGLGAREWRRAHPERVQALPVTHPRYTTDVDTPADLDRLRSEYSTSLDWPRDSKVAGEDL